MKLLAVLLLGIFLLCRAAAADRIALRPAVPDRSGPARVVYRFDRPLSGPGRLVLEWTDALGRLVERREVPVGPRSRRTIAFRLDMRRAVAMGNTLRGRVLPAAAGAAPRGAVLAFVARPPRGWLDWQIIEYQARDPVRLAALGRLGVTAGMLLANRNDTVRRPVDDAVAPFLQQDLRWYVENIATDFYAAYHRWFADRPVNAAFTEVQDRHRQDPADQSVFFRRPGLADPAWLKRIHDRLVRTVHAYAPYRPLYYNLADEPGIGDLAAAWDFDFAPASLAGLRGWLRSRYASLAALNREWGSNFARWDAVVPMTTDQALQRGDDNLSAWADFKEWMDVAFARAVRFGTQAIHQADPNALSAIEGAQIPGWGGYDYTRLPRSVDVMEIYDAGENVDIARSLDPGLVLLMTAAGGDPAQTHALWHGLLQGMRGVILWDENDALVRADGGLGPWGHQAAPLFATLGGGLASLLVNSRPARDPVATLYSPASLRIQWLLDRRSQGTNWANRDAEAEYQETAPRRAMGVFTRLLRNSGVQQRFISPALLAHGELSRGKVRVLILPHVIALSGPESAAIRRFVAQGGTVIADVMPGIFDQHGRHLSHAALADLFARAPGIGAGRAILYPVDPPPPAAADGGTDPVALGRLSSWLAQARVEPPLRVTTPDGEPATDVAIYRYRFGATTIVALQRDLGPTAAGAAPVAKTVELALRRSFFVEDLDNRRALGFLDRLPVTLDPDRPALLALAARAPVAPRISAPLRAEAGRDAGFAIRMPAMRRGDAALLSAEVVDPAGRTRPGYGGQLLVPPGGRRWRLPLALNDPPGSWAISFADVASGRRTISHLEVAAAARRDFAQP